MTISSLSLPLVFRGSLFFFSFFPAAQVNTPRRAPLARRTHTTPLPYSRPSEISNLESAGEVGNDAIIPATRVWTPLSSGKRRVMAREREKRAGGGGARAGGAVGSYIGCVWNSTGGISTSSRRSDCTDNSQVSPMMMVTAAKAAASSGGGGGSSWTNKSMRRGEADAGADAKKGGWGGHIGRLRIAPCPLSKSGSFDTSASPATTNAWDGSATSAQAHAEQGAVDPSKEVKGGRKIRSRSSQSSDGTHGASAVADAAAAAAAAMTSPQIWQDYDGDAPNGASSMSEGGANGVVVEHVNRLFAPPMAASAVCPTGNAVTSGATAGTPCVSASSSKAQYALQPVSEHNALVGQRMHGRRGGAPETAKEDLHLGRGGPSGHRRMFVHQRSYSDDSDLWSSDMSRSECSKSDLAEVMSDLSVGMTLARHNNTLQDEALARAAASAAAESAAASPSRSRETAL